MYGSEILRTQKGKQCASPFDGQWIVFGLVHADGDLPRFRFLYFRHVDLQNPVAIGGFDAILLHGLRQVKGARKFSCTRSTR